MLCIFRPFDTHLQQKQKMRSKNNDFSAGINGANEMSDFTTLGDRASFKKAILVLWDTITRSFTKKISCDTPRNTHEINFLGRGVTYDAYGTLTANQLYLDVKKYFFTKIYQSEAYHW